MAEFLDGQPSVHDDVDVAPRRGIEHSAVAAAGLQRHRACGRLKITRPVDDAILPTSLNK